MTLLQHLQYFIDNIFPSGLLKIHLRSSLFGAEDIQQFKPRVYSTAWLQTDAWPLSSGFIYYRRCVFCWTLPSCVLSHYRRPESCPELGWESINKQDDDVGNEETRREIFKKSAVCKINFLHRRAQSKERKKWKGVSVNIPIVICYYAGGYYTHLQSV